MFRLLFYFVFVYCATWVIGGTLIVLFLVMIGGPPKTEPIEIAEAPPAKPQRIEPPSMPRVILKDHKFIPVTTP
jgi:hypothetical protein